MTQPVSYQPLTTLPGIVRFVADRVTLKQVCLGVVWFSHQYISTNTPYSLIRYTVYEISNVIK